MSKLILGIIIGIIVSVPVGVLAQEFIDYHDKPFANDIYQLNHGCSDNNFNTAPETCNLVAVFDDAGNKCYIVYDRVGTHASISCIKGDR